MSAINTGLPLHGRPEIALMLNLPRNPRLSVRAIIRAGLCALLLIPVISRNVDAQDTRREPVVPNFWDPKARATRPPPGAVDAIRFVTTDDFPPFNFLDSNGRLTGFNLDLARAVCAELSLPCTVQARPWDDLAASVIEGRADAAIAGVAINDETRKTLGFTDIYLRVPGRFVAKRDGAELQVTAGGLRRHSVGVVAGTAHEAYLKEFFPDAKTTTFESPEKALAALKAGDIELFFGDGIQLSFWLQGEAAADCCVFAGGPYLESRYFGLGFAIAVAPQAKDLRSALNTALETVYSNGTYAELYLRYFPVGFY
jgi:polar amino acid transport system substrate-binding protein